MALNYSLQAFNLFDSLNIKSLRNALSGKVLDSSTQELHLQYGEASFLSIFRFGALVFFNMPQKDIEAETAKIKSVIGPGLAFPTSETYQVTVKDGPTNVEFEHVEIKKVAIEYLRLIHQTMAQSAALEYFEIRVDRMLYDTSSFMEKLAQGGKVPVASKRLTKIIGSTASTRQNILSNLAILDPPDATWKSKELEKLHKELSANFDIEVRFRTLDRKLTLIQDNIEILSDLATSRRATLLEALIVLLILFEIVMKFIEPG